MSGYEEDKVRLVQRSASNSSFVREPTNLISDVDAPGTATLQSNDLHGPQDQSKLSTSSPSPTNELNSDSPADADSISVSNVPFLSPSNLRNVELRHPMSAAERVTRPTRTGPPPSRSATFSMSKLPWQSSGDMEPRSPIERAASVGRGIAGRLRSIKVGASRRLSTRPSGSDDDEMEVGLVRDAYKSGTGKAPYSMVKDIDEDEMTDYHGVDITSFAGGPTAPNDEATLLQYRQLESNGQLTGGLGTGDKPDATVMGKDLLSSASSPTSLSRGLSRGHSRLKRAATMRDLAQAEANKRGQVIEVIVEENIDGLMSASGTAAGGQKIAEFDSRGPDEVTGIDLTSYGGESRTEGGFDPTSSQRDVTSGRATGLTRVETFYPVANWKPVSMQWPYLTSLIVISAVVCGSQEYLYQRSAANLKLDPPQGLYTFYRPQDVKTWDYFCFKYLPTMLAVTYGVLWQLTDLEVRRLEPYYQLSKVGGALAAESINVDYITVFDVWRPILALRLRHWAVAISSCTAILAVSVVPILLSASLSLEPDRATRLKLPSEPKLIVIIGSWSRVLSATLGIIATSGCCLLFLLQRRDSGLVEDVKGIAGIAAMATKSHILMDFKDLDTVSPKDIHNKLKDHRYTLRNSSLAPDENVPVSRRDKDKYDHFKLPQNPHPFMLRLVAGVPMITGMVLFLAFIPVILFTSASVVTDRAPWVLTALAVMIKVAYQTVEQDLRMMEPFYRLSCRHALPKVLKLDYTGMAFGYLPVMAALNGDYLIALIGLGSMLAEVLTVCVTSFAGITGADFLPPPSVHGNAQVSRSGETADHGEETPMSFWVSFALSTTILLYLIITSMLAYMQRRHAFLPRQPSTIASVLAFIHQSKMLYDFASQAKGEGNDGLVRRLLAEGKTYGLGWFTGRDGETHCGVDEEELRGNYVHKTAGDVRLATKPWLGHWDTY
ncbi:MAG: hypothetical protein M1818_006298 [Claussenomyces sp. TS43310]|nr:MAG: hypothetical protein M1818_006298 [Claussenomyces sp. TS43310]